MGVKTTQLSEVLGRRHINLDINNQLTVVYNQGRKADRAQETGCKAEISVQN